MELDSNGHASTCLRAMSSDTCQVRAPRRRNLQWFESVPVGTISVRANQVRALYRLRTVSITGANSILIAKYQLAALISLTSVQLVVAELSAHLERSLSGQ